MTEQENQDQPNEPLTLEQRIERLSFEVGTLTLEVQALRKELAELGDLVDEKTDNDHLHWEYASVDHVERSENSFSNQLSRLRDDLSNLEYRVNDAERKAERAQSTADAAQRSSGGRGGWY